jgi:tripartite-type tricarboxylate transporter receptor subunit TctC
MTFSASPRRRTLRATAALALGAAIASACAQSFPVKTVEIVPFGSAGGAIDAIARARSWP